MYKFDKKYLFKLDESDKIMMLPCENFISETFSESSENKSLNLFELKEDDESKDLSNKSKRKNKRIVFGILAFFAVIIIISNVNTSPNYGYPKKISTIEEELNYKETSTLQKLKPTFKDEGDAIFFEDIVKDAFGNSMTNVVHPGSTGTAKTTGGGGAHDAQGFNRIYKNDGYAYFSGTLFISEEYVNYTKHKLTLIFEVYGDEKLLYEAPKWQTGNSYDMLPFDIDISAYNDIRIHFEAVNDSNLFSWENCAFGIAEPIFSKLSIGEQSR